MCDAEHPSHRRPTAPSGSSLTFLRTSHPIACVFCTFYRVSVILIHFFARQIPNWGSNGICTTTPLVRARLIRPGEPPSRSTRSGKRGPPTHKPVTVTPEPSNGVVSTYSPLWCVRLLMHSQSATLRPYEAPAEQQIGTTGCPSLATPSCTLSVTGASSSPESAHHRVRDSSRAYNFPNAGMFADTPDGSTTIPTSTPIPPYLHHQVLPPPGFPPIASQFSNVEDGGGTTMPTHLLWSHAVRHSAIGMGIPTAAQNVTAQPMPAPGHHQHARAYPSVPAYNPEPNYPTFSNDPMFLQAPDETQRGLAPSAGHTYRNGGRRDNRAAAASYGSSRRYNPYYRAHAGSAMPRDTQSTAASAYRPAGQPAIAPFPQTEERRIASRSDIGNLPSHDVPVPTNLYETFWNYPWQDGTTGQTAPRATPMDASQAAVHVQSHSFSLPSSAHIPVCGDESHLGMLGGDDMVGRPAGTPSDELVAYYTTYVTHQLQNTYARGLPS